MILESYASSDTIKEAGMVFKPMSEGLNAHPTKATIHSFSEACKAPDFYDTAFSTQGFPRKSTIFLVRESDGDHICGPTLSPLPEAVARTLAEIKDFQLNWSSSNRYFCGANTDCDAKPLVCLVQLGYAEEGSAP